MKRIYRINSNDKTITENTTVWVGIDVHKTNASITVVGGEDNILHQSRVPMERAHFESLVRRLPKCRIEAVYEAGPTGYQLYRWLEELGVSVTMVAPSMVPKRSGEYVKTDKRDSRKLAEMLRGQILHSIHVHTDDQYEERELLRTRRQLVRKRTSLYQQIKAKLLFHGHKFEFKCWSDKLLTELEHGPTGRPGVDLSIGVLVRTIRCLNDQIRVVEEAIVELAKTEPYRQTHEHLVSIPGVGTITAMTFLTELGELARFETDEKLVSYLGLAPSEHTTNGRGHRGGLPKKGNPHIRDMLVQAAWKLISKDSRMREVYERIKHGKGPFGAQIAIVGVARRLALAMRALWRDQTSYNYKPLKG